MERAGFDAFLALELVLMILRLVALCFPSWMSTGFPLRIYLE